MRSLLRHVPLKRIAAKKTGNPIATNRVSQRRWLSWIAGGVMFCIGWLWIVARVPMEPR